MSPTLIWPVPTTDGCCGGPAGLLHDRAEVARIHAGTGGAKAGEADAARRQGKAAAKPAAALKNLGKGQVSAISASFDPFWRRIVNQATNLSPCGNNMTPAKAGDRVRRHEAATLPHPACAEPRKAGPKLCHSRADGRGPGPGARAAYRRHPDRQSGRHHAPRAGSAGRGGRDRLRGHPRHPQAARPLWHRNAADALSRPQRRRGAAEDLGAACGGRSGGAGFRRRHAARFRSRLQAGRRRARGRPRGDHAAGRFRDAGGAHGRRASDRPFLLRRILAAEGRRAPHAHRGAGAHSGDAGAVRERTAAWRFARRSRGRIGRARSGGLPRTDQAA